MTDAPLFRFREMLGAFFVLTLTAWYGYEVGRGSSWSWAWAAATGA